MRTRFSDFMSNSSSGLWPSKPWFEKTDLRFASGKVACSGLPRTSADVNVTDDLFSLSISADSSLIVSL